MSTSGLLGGKYVLGPRIGMGAMGVVHRAEQPALARSVAIKLLHRHLAEDPRIASRFRAEALTAAQLSHPNLVTVIDYGETDAGTPFLVMELVHGRALGEIVRAGGAMTVERAVGLVRQILAGLAEAHDAGVVHADVKSDNVLVEEHGHGGERIKLVDFGLARIGHADASTHHPAGGTRVVAGTPEYMAPEVIRGEEPTAAADLYGVGVVLYELLTGAPPFTDGDPTAVMARHLDEPVAPPSLRRAERTISAALDAVVARALAKQPVERFPNADAFAAALEAIAADGHTKRASVAPVSTPVADEHDLRRAVAEAIGAGAREEIARGYIELAGLLVARGQVHAAIAELEAGIDLLTAGGGPEVADGPATRMVAALMPLYDALGDPREACTGAAAHWRTWSGAPIER